MSHNIMIVLINLDSECRELQTADSIALTKSRVLCVLRSVFFSVERVCKGDGRCDQDRSSQLWRQQPPVQEEGNQ